MNRCDRVRPCRAAIHLNPPRAPSYRASPPRRKLVHHPLPWPQPLVAQPTPASIPHLHSSRCTGSGPSLHRPPFRPLLSPFPTSSSPTQHQHLPCHARPAHVPRGNSALALLACLHHQLSPNLLVQAGQSTQAGSSAPALSCRNFLRLHLSNDNGGNPTGFCCRCTVAADGVAHNLAGWLLRAVGDHSCSSRSWVLLYGLSRPLRAEVVEAAMKGW